MPTRHPGSVMKRRRRRRTQVSVAVLVVTIGGATALAAAARNDRTSSEASRSVRSTPRGALASTTTSVPPGTPTGKPVTLAFAGDVNFNASQSPSLLADPGSRLRPMRALLEGADLAVVNLETAITDRGQAASKAFTFRAPPSILRAFSENGVDAVSMANNHGMDFGADGLADSIAAKSSAPVEIIGVGADEDEAFAPFRATVKGQRIAVIAATQVLDSGLIDDWTATPDRGGVASAKRVDRLGAEVRRARATSDTVVVFLHWGVERTTCPSDDQQALARRLVDAGADIVVGSHAHRVLGGGRLDEALVHYGLGNFGFYSAGPDASRTGVLTVTVRGRSIDSYEWAPGVIRDRVPYPLSGAAGDQARDAWDAQRACTGLKP